ncbi:phage tail family protein [Clostridium sp. SHJSY1]|uniref:distal tail protein Dit n=1 Tax=Clostridium sp. SHJSY1 TaxID=2942483 RepID=UPI002873F56C|nr:distal tail protein Dit [Clostridium sp. SHJSY1]MDS0525454.1 phage tail family protein [Clostridium sp. SHJSY1]
MQEYTGYFNNKYFYDDLGLFVADYSSYTQINEKVEDVEVEGRSGTLTIKSGAYPNRKKDIKFRLRDNENLWFQIDNILEWLDNIEDNRLIYDREDRAYRVKRVEKDDITKKILQYGEFTATFICEPFLTDLENTIYEITSNNFSFYYNGTAPGESLIKVYGSGNIQLAINDETMQINNVSNYVEVDSKLMQIRNQDLTSKDDVLGDFILFEKGNNTISYTGNVTKIIVEYTTQYK